jgi:hypothetical protein
LTRRPWTDDPAYKANAQQNDAQFAQKIANATNAFP